MDYESKGRAGVDMGGRSGRMDRGGAYAGDQAQEAAIEQKLRDHHRDQDSRKVDIASGEAIAGLLRHAGFNIDALADYGNSKPADAYRRAENARLSDTVTSLNQKEFEPTRPKRSGVLEDMIGFVNSEIEMLRNSTNRLCNHTDRVQGTPPKDDMDGAVRSTLAADDGPAISRLWTVLHELSDMRRGVMNQVDRATTLIDL